MEILDTYTLLQCMSSKSGGWDQFSTDIALAIVCLSQGRTFNFSKYIFDEMLGNVKDTKLKYLMYPRFLQIILGIQTTDTTHLPVKGLSSKLFASMKTNYKGDHRPLLPAMLLAGNAADRAAAGGQDPADVQAPVDSPERAEVAPDANASVAADALPPLSPRPSTPSPPLPIPSPTTDAPTEHVVTEDFAPDQPVQSPQLTRIPTPSPLSPTFEENVDIVADWYNSPVRTNDAPNTTDIPVGGAEGPVTLTSLSLLLDRYVHKMDTLEKELNHTKKTLGKAVVTLVKRVKKLENKLKTKKRKGAVIDSDEEVIAESDKLDLEGLHLLATTTLESDQHEAPVSRPATTAHSVDKSSPKDQKVSYVRRKYLADLHKMTDDLSSINIDMSDVPADKTPADASQSGDTVFVASQEYVVSSRKETSADPMPKVVPADESADLHIDCPDGSQAKDSTDQHSAPPEATSTQKDKGKSVMVDQDIPSRKKSKQELANEKLSELVAS